MHTRQSIYLIILVCINSFLYANSTMFLGNITHSYISNLSSDLQLIKEIKLDVQVFSSPSIVDDIIYFGARNNKIYAVNAKTGEIKWQYETSDCVDSSPSVINSNLYVCCKDGYFYCLDINTGKLCWNFKTGGTDLSSPVVYNDKVFFGSGYPNKSIFCLNIKTGEKIWEYQTLQMVYSSPVVFNNTVFCGSNDAKIYAIDIDTGHLKWNYKTDGGIFCSSASIQNDTLYFSPGQYSKTLFALNIDTGKEKWCYVPDDFKDKEYIVSSSVVVQNNVGYINLGHEQTYLYAIDTITKTLKWKAYTGKAEQIGYTSSPVISSDNVYICSADNNIYGFNKETGQQIFQYTTSAPIYSTPVIVNNFLYVISSNGTIYIFEGNPVATKTIELPKKTKIKSNYPNPFNPECYIPYEIKNEEIKNEVKIRIYNVLGQKVRELNLGEKKAGYYLTKDKAAYWDGKDNNGRELSSGVYYYELVVNDKVIGMKKSLALK